MKVLKVIFIWMILALLCVPVNRLLAGTYGDFTYTDNGTTITIVSYAYEADGVANIPGMIDGKPVTSIGYEAFADHPGLTSVYIPEGVLTISDYAFWNCDLLTSVNISEGVLTIEGGAFEDCDSLTGITVPASVTSIGDFAFADCNSLQYINVSGGNPTYWSWDGVLYQIIPITLHRDLIQCPGGLAGFQFPGLVDDIHDYALANCDKLTSVYIPEGIRNIGRGAFLGCDGMTSVTIPHSIIGIGDLAFADCRSLQTFTVNGDEVYISVLGALYRRAMPYNDSILYLIQCPAGWGGSFIFPFPGNVTSINDYAFFGCDRLTSVTIPSSVTHIGIGAFGYCNGLTSVTIPSSVTQIGDYAFDGCTGLTSATFLGDAPLLGSGAFSETQASFRVYYDFWWYGFQDVPWNEYTAVKPASPEVSVQQPVGYNVVDGSLLEFWGKPFVIEMTANTAETYTIKNTGSANLLGLAIIKGGPNSGDFTVSALGVNMLAPGASTTFTVTFVPTALGERSAWIQIASNDADESPFEITFGGTATTVNNAPTISDVTDKSTSEDTATSAIAFTIGDIDTPIGSLTVTRASSNATLAPLANVVLGGSGANRTVTITPAAGQSGIATITLTVSDGTLTASDSFLLTVIDDLILAGWRQLHFLTPDNTGDAADLADPDKDGLKNLIEFAFGLNPKSGASMQLPQAQRVGGNLVITFIEPAGIGGITYGAEWSPTMEAASWMPVTDTGSGGTHTFSVPIGTQAGRFMRLKVTNP
jgi:hypothetical protein